MDLDTHLDTPCAAALRRASGPLQALGGRKR